MSTASRASTQLGYRFFPSILISLTELDYVFPQSVEVSRLVWLGLASGSFHRCTFVPLLLRVAAVASRCWSWEVWELLDIPLEVCQPCGTILGNGAGLEAAEWPGECLVSPWCLGCSNAQGRRVDTVLTQPGRTWPCVLSWGNTANLPKQLL